MIALIQQWWAWALANPKTSGPIALGFVLWAILNVMKRPNPAELTGWKKLFWLVVDRLVVLEGALLGGGWKWLLVASTYPTPAAAEQDPKAPMPPPGLIGMLMLILSTSMILAGVQGCGAGSKVCAGIDLAEMACNTFPIRYLASADGGTETVTVSKEELMRFTHDVSLKRAAEQKDAGSCDGCGK